MSTSKRNNSSPRSAVTGGAKWRTSSRSRALELVERGLGDTGRTAQEAPSVKSRREDHGWFSGACCCCKSFCGESENAC